MPPRSDAITTSNWQLVHSNPLMCASLSAPAAARTECALMPQVVPWDQCGWRVCRSAAHTRSPTERCFDDHGHMADSRPPAWLGGATAEHFTHHLSDDVTAVCDTASIGLRSGGSFRDVLGSCCGSAS